jgi:hypothetical protein
MKALSLPLVILAFALTTPSIVVAKDPVGAVRACMVRHGAVRKPDGSVWLSGGRQYAEGIRAMCRKQAGYR